MSSEGVKNTVALMVITLVAGVLLGLVYEITKDPIAKEQQRAKEEAYSQVFADAASFEAMEIDKQSIERELKGQGMDASIDEVMRVHNESGKTAGYVLTVTDHEGYGGDIQFAMGVADDGTVNGISFLSISETAGLGMKAKDDAFKNQFKGKKAERFSYTKNGAAAEDEIDALSGATITTNAVTNGVNAGLYYICNLSNNE